ncbi:uncharacterized protein J7T54_001196 [Emericellopsis cladophorae]|uniref:CFEM domain-containing protein n=1 Tax=Emericellopsis cladophorae TaxID=2686198 RepID=A0A9Q0BCD3_9HYPO|nr:uncharacterized protein J7T54_001196 [Emericellopsis cladophorae]KAI6780692.1 hypothetical protein J7T54_001196 [Emericellopsis cladophorae]
MRRTAWLAGLMFAMAAMISPVSAQNASSNGQSGEMDFLVRMPNCALQCFLEMRAAQEAPCDPEDLDCLCQSAAFGNNAVTSCVVRTCSTKESLLARNLISTACKLPVRDHSQTYTIVAIVFCVFSGLAVLQRFMAKLLVVDATIGMDDYMVLLAAAIQAPMAAIGVEMGVANGLGRDIWTLEFHQITRFGYALYIFTNLYFANIAVIKLAFVFFYLRVFPKRNVRRYLWATVALVVCFGTAFVVAGIFQCTPISYYWTRWKEEATDHGHCVDVSALAWANGAISIGIDLWMIAIPLSQVHNLNLDWKKKAEVAFMFCVGLFVTVMACIRLESLISNDVHSPNATWVKQEVAIWSTIEVNVGIICACLPSLRTLVVLLFGRIPLLSSSFQRAQRPRPVQDGDDEKRIKGGFRKSKAFGTISRSIAEPVEGGRSRSRAANERGIRMETEVAVEFETMSAEDDEARLMKRDAELGLALSHSALSHDSSSSNSLDKHKEIRP